MKYFKLAYLEQDGIYVVGSSAGGTLLMTEELVIDGGKVELVEPVKVDGLDWNVLEVGSVARRTTIVPIRKLVVAGIGYVRCAFHAGVWCVAGEFHRFGPEYFAEKALCTQ